MPSRAERTLNAVVNAVFAVLGGTLRGITAALAFVLRRGRHRSWRKGR